MSCMRMKPRSSHNSFAQIPAMCNHYLLLFWFKSLSFSYSVQQRGVPPYDTRP